MPRETLRIGSEIFRRVRNSSKGFPSDVPLAEGSPYFSWAFSLVVRVPRSSPLRAMSAEHPFDDMALAIRIRLAYRIVAGRYLIAWLCQGRGERGIWPNHRQKLTGGSRLRVLAGARKGAFILTSDGKRERWDMSSPRFGGWEIYHLKGSPVDPNLLCALQSSGWFAQLTQRSNDGGKTPEPVGNKFVHDRVPGTHPCVGIRFRVR